MNSLHIAIGNILRSTKLPNTDVLLDSACGGNEHIRFYGKEPPGRNTCMVWVDAAIILNGKIKIVVEIEESNIRPLHLCGKVLATAVSQYYSGQHGHVPLSSSLMFIQVFIKQSEREDWSKLDQCRYLAAEFEKLFAKSESRVACYSPHFGTVEEFSTADHRTAFGRDMHDFLEKFSHKSDS
jgi:hypothetical protein